MPDCSENYESEIAEGRNIRSIKCKYCNSTILKPSIASFATVQLPLMKQIGGTHNPETEELSLFWLVTDMLMFENVGFSNTVGNNKYLTCADCEAGPIGYYDLPSSRALHIATSSVLWEVIVMNSEMSYGVSEKTLKWSGVRLSIPYVLGCSVHDFN